jgi:hypothetical protein
LRGTAPHSGQVRDALASLGDGGHGSLLERLTDGVPMSIQLTDRYVPVGVLPKTLQPPLAKLFHVPKHGRSADAHQLGGLFASFPMVQQ